MGLDGLKFWQKPPKVEADPAEAAATASVYADHPEEIRMGETSRGETATAVLAAAGLAAGMGGAMAIQGIPETNSKAEQKPAAVQVIDARGLDTHQMDAKGTTVKFDADKSIAEVAVTPRVDQQTPMTIDTPQVPVVSDSEQVPINPK